MNLSIIIPVYNVEKYIEQCVESVLKQKLNKYELILVDDGSTDCSGMICDEYAKKYSNIKVIHQENKGLSGARNTGIKAAKGKFLMFIDSDDFIANNVNFKKLIDCNEEIIQYKMVYYYDNQDKYVYLKDNDTYDKLNFYDKLSKMVEKGNMSISACDKIVRRKLLIDNNIYFKEGLLSEDIDWSLKVYLHAKSLKVTNENVYIYRQQRPGSISSRVKEKSVISLFNIIKYWYNYEYDNVYIKRIYLNYLAYQYTILLTIISKKNCNNQLKKEIYSLKDLLNYSENYKVKMCNKIFKIFGIKLGRYILKMYIYLKNKGLIKL